MRNFTSAAPGLWLDIHNCPRPAQHKGIFFVERSDTRKKPTGLKTSLGAITITNPLQLSMKPMFPVCHCPPSAAVPLLYRQAGRIPSRLHRYLRHAAHELCQLPYTQGKERERSRERQTHNSILKYFGNSDYIVMQNIFIYHPRTFLFIPLSAILFVPALPQMHKHCERRRNVYSIWWLLKNQKSKQNPFLKQTFHLKKSLYVYRKDFLTKV